MKNFTFSADANLQTFWDTVAVTADGNIYDDARRIFVDLVVGQEEDDYGIEDGGEIQAFLSIVDQNDNSTDISPFPGSLSIEIGNRAIRIEWFDPRENFLAIRVFMDGLEGAQGVEITENIQEIHIDINSFDGSVLGWFSYENSDVLGIVEIETVTMI